jgi:hypothetical protein
MNLPNGITGFYNLKKNQPPKVDGKQFKQLCFAIITRNGGKVLEFKEPQYPMNFYDVEVKIFNKDYHILLNEYYPYLVFASSVNCGKIIYVDEPQLSRDFIPYYKVLSVSVLNKPLNIKETNGMIVLENNNKLNSAELDQISYWKPKTIGDIVYNFWD